MKKHLISTFALAMIFSSSINVQANNKITDIDGHWAQNQISNFIEKSYVKGYEDNTFKPDNQITRAEFVRLVNMYFGFNNKGISQFKDINQNSWYYNDICIAIQEGYINGYEDNTFRPDNIITREEATKIIVSIKQQQDNIYDKLNTFSDNHLVSNWAKPYVEGAIENGYLKGDNLKKLNPTSCITRAESVSLLCRVENEDFIKPVINNKENENTNLVDNIDNYPELNYHLVTYSLEKGGVWENNMINATAFDNEYNQIEVHYEGNVDTNVVGYYTVTISATDYNGRTTKEEVYVEVEDPDVIQNRHLYPQIISRDLELKKGDKFDYTMLEATSFDNDENDISDTITYKGNVDTNKKGRYPVYISAKDKAGLISTLLVFVYIE